MEMGKRKKRQGAMWVAASDLPKSPGHPFYQRLNAVLEEAGFDSFAERICARFYAGHVGRPSLLPGRYFRLLLLGYFEGLDSERGIAWRAADSLAVRSFLSLGVEERGPDHSTISRTRRLIDVETHREVFSWVLERLGQAGLLKGATILVDGTTLEANAAMRSIVRRDSGEKYEEYLTGLAKASGVRTPTRGVLARLDRRRAKKGSNEEWKSPSDPDAKITKMKDGRTHLAHKAEHAVDLESGAIVALTVQDASIGDTGTIMETLAEAEGQLLKLRREALAEDMQEVVADKGYHSDDVLVGLDEVGLRAYISPPSVDGVAGADRSWRSGRSTRIAVGPAAIALSVCSGSGASASSGRSLTCTRPGECDGRIYAATRTSSNGYWSTRVRSIWVGCCDRRSGSERRAACRAVPFVSCRCSCASIAP